MISITKIQEPDVLIENALAWRSELLLAIEDGDQERVRAASRRYNHPEIKRALIQETSGKCAYCEGTVLDVAFGDIEHFYPRILYRDRTFDWDNLTFSCQRCNNTKSDLDPDQVGLVNPYLEDPEEFIEFVGHVANSRGTEKGSVSIQYLGLNRADVQESRLGVFLQLIRLRERIQAARSDVERAALIEDFEENELGHDREFAAMRRAFWRRFRP